MKSVIMGDELAALHTKYVKFEQRGKYILDRGKPMALIDIKRYPLTVANSFAQITQNIKSGGRGVCKALASPTEFVIHANIIAQATRRQAGNLIILNSYTYDFVDKAGIVSALSNHRGNIMIDNDLEDFDVFFGLEEGKMDRTIIWKEDGTMLYNLERLANNWIKLQYS